VAEQLQDYIEAGVSEFILMPLGPDPLTQYERLAEVRRTLVKWPLPAAGRRSPGRRTPARPAGENGALP
jgi:hypothetical protein